MLMFAAIKLNLFGAGRRNALTADDLDVALAGAQIGLEKKRQRWLLFLVQKEEQCMKALAQTSDLTLDPVTTDEDRVAADS